MIRFDDLAARYGTPLYVYDVDEITEARSALFASLPAGAELFYALKANPHPELVRALGSSVDGGPACRAEISSTGELVAALTAGLNAAECLYTGPGKTPTELRTAVKLGVRMFSTDSVTDVQHVGAAAREHGVVADVLLRVNSLTASASTSIRMTGTPSQFGFDSETLPELLPQLRRTPGVRLCGMHFFPLSNARDEASLTGEFEHTLATAAELQRQLGLPLRLLDIGGGFSVPYGVPGARAGYPKLRDALTTALDVHFPNRVADGMTIAFESGRYLVGAAGTMVTRVTNVKSSRGKKFVILDAGINTLGGMSGLGRLLPASVVPEPAPESLAAAGEAEVDVANLVGPLCTPGDILGREVKVPRLNPGDLVTIPNVGAYGPTASLLMFLGREAPVEVIVRGDLVLSASRVMHRRSYEIEDLSS